MIKPSDIVQEMRLGRGGSGEPLRFYWVTATHETEPSGRSAFVADMARLTSEEAVCSVSPRAKRFTHPDMIVDDLASTLEEIKSEILAPPLKGLVQATGSLDVVVVSRKRFELTVSTSPLHLPEWFPVSPGQLVDVSVTDLTMRAAVPLSEVDTGELCRLLFELDRALIIRFRAGLDAAPRLVGAFLDECRDRPAKAASYGELLTAVEEKLAVVKNPRYYRPSTARSPTLVGRIWRLADAKSANDLVRLAERLASAARLESASLGDSREALLTVLVRPSRKMPSMESRWAYNLIMGVRGACRLITAAAHADEYGRYPAWLLRSRSLDLRKSLDDAVRVLTS